MIILLILIPLVSFASKEELIELQIAGLTAERIHMQNSLLFGLDPETCKSSDDPRVLKKQLTSISQNRLSHCLKSIEANLKAIDEKINQLERGELTFKSSTELASRQKIEFSEIKNPEPIESKPEDEIVWPTLGTATERIISPEAQDRHKTMIDYYSSNRSMFEPNEEDSLFEIISKGYIRNLHKMEPGN